MSLRDKVLARKTKEETLELDGDNFLVVGKTKRERAALFAKSRKKDQSLDYERLENVILSECVLDPETKAKLLEPAEWDGVVSELTGPLVAACMRLLGMDKTDLSPKDSDSTET